MVDDPQIPDSCPNILPDLQIGVALNNTRIRVYSFRSRYTVPTTRQVLSHLQSQCGCHLSVYYCAVGPCIYNTAHQFPIDAHMTYILGRVPPQQVAVITQILCPTGLVC